MSKAQDWVDVVHGDSRPTFENIYGQTLCVVAASEDSRPMLAFKTNLMSQGDAIRLAFWIMETFAQPKVNAEKFILDEIRAHLKAGASIRASDPDGRILEPESPECWHGGLTIDYPKGKNPPVQVAT